VRIATDAWIARAVLYHGRRMLGAGLGFPQFSDGVADIRASARAQRDVGALDQDRAAPPRAAARAR
jgi:hypothetical protein